MLTFYILMKIKFIFLFFFLVVSDNSDTMPEIALEDGCAVSISIREPHVTEMLRTGARRAVQKKLESRWWMLEKKYLKKSI